MKTVTPQDVALITNNVTAYQAEPFQLYDARFNAILDPNASLSLLLHDPQGRPLFHEGGIYINTTSPSIYASSNRFNSSVPSPSTNNENAVITHIFFNASTSSWSYKVISPGPPNLTVNGGFGNGSHIVFTSQGSLTQPGGLFSMAVPSAKATNATYTTTALLDNYLGLPFNSPNDVYITRTGTIYFTDPPIAFAQGFRPAPSLPPSVYVYMPGTTHMRVAALGLVNPNGISFSPDEQTAYITDTIGGTSPTLPRAIYAFDVRAGGALAGMRTFATPALGIPDGIKTDSVGNVYACCGDGVNVWDPEGVLLGKVIVPNGCSNFAFGPNGHLYVFNEERLFLAKLGAGVQPNPRYLS